MSDLLQVAEQIGREMAREKVASMDLAHDYRAWPALALLNAGGYFAGREVSRDMKDRGEKRPRFGLGSALGAALVPGGLGYVIGKREAYPRNKKSDKK